MDNTENLQSSSESISSPNPILPSTIDKRSIDENAVPHVSKRLRSSCSQSSNITTIIKWIPPSNELVRDLQSRSSSLFQFTLSLVNTILSSTVTHLTDEHSRWLHSTLYLYDPNYNNNKLHLLIETAWKIAQSNLCQMN
jgi:hypothetical protein